MFLGVARPDDRWCHVVAFDPIDTGEHPMRHRLCPPLIAGALVALAVFASAGVATAGPGTLAASSQRVSVDSNEQQFDTYHDIAAVSANGRYVAFDQGGGQVYVRDRTGGTTELISDAASASDPDISANGTLVVFFSIGMPWGFRTVSLYDRSTDTLGPVVPTTAGSCDTCYAPAISGSGAVIAFESDDTDLVADDTNGRRDVFVRDRTAGTTELISVSSSEVQGNGVSSQAAVSANGRYVAFRSEATNLVPGDTNGKADVFVRDRVAGTTQRVSLDSAETQGNDFSQDPDISSTGQFVTFDSKANNWPGATGAVLTYVRDRAAGTTEMVSVSTAGQISNNTFGSGVPAISDNGRYVAFASSGNNLVPGDTNNASDVFLRDRTTGTTSRISVSTSGAQANAGSRTPAISGKATVPIVAFVSDATNLVAGDTNGYRDIFARKVS